MTKRLPILDTDHVVRYVPKGRRAVDEDGNLLGNGIAWNALQQRQGETYVSVNWLEFHSRTRGQQLPKAQELALVRDDLAQAYPRKNGEALLAIANVGEVKKIAGEADKPVRVTHEPSRPNNLSHAGIRQLSNTQNALMDRLAAEAFAETVLACKY